MVPKTPGEKPPGPTLSQAQAGGVRGGALAHQHRSVRSKLSWLRQHPTCRHDDNGLVAGQRAMLDNGQNYYALPYCEAPVHATAQAMVVAHPDT